MNRFGRRGRGNQERGGEIRKREGEQVGEEGRGKPGKGRGNQEEGGGRGTPRGKGREILTEIKMINLEWEMDREHGRDLWLTSELVLYTQTQISQQMASLIILLFYYLFPKPNRSDQACSFCHIHFFYVFQSNLRFKIFQQKMLVTFRKNVRSCF